MNPPKANTLGHCSGAKIWEVRIQMERWPIDRRSKSAIGLLGSTIKHSSDSTGLSSTASCQRARTEECPQENQQNRLGHCPSLPIARVCPLHAVPCSVSYERFERPASRA